VISLISLLAISALSSGHSILLNSEYSLATQLLSSFILFAVGLGLLLRIVQGRLSHYRAVAASTVWLERRWRSLWSECESPASKSEPHLHSLDSLQADDVSTFRKAHHSISEREFDEDSSPGVSEKGLELSLPLTTSADGNDRQYSSSRAQSLSLHQPLLQTD